MWRHTAADALPPLAAVKRPAPASSSSSAARSSRVAPALRDADAPEYIVIGLGMAGGVVAARLAEAGKRVTIIEMGGAMQADTGGVTLEVPAAQGASEYLRAVRVVDPTISAAEAKLSELCYTDIPGEYNNVAFQSKGQRFQIRECAAAGFQGMGFGGNGVFNGMLYQEPARWWFDDAVMNDVFVGPKQKAAGFKTASEVLLPYYTKVREAISDDGAEITAIPSNDGVHYNHGLYDLLKPTLSGNDFKELPLHSYDLEKAGDRFFGVPTVITKKGVRNGPQAYLSRFLDADGKPKSANVKVLTYCKATSLITQTVNGKVTITGVNVEQRDLQDEALACRWADTVKVKAGGSVILCCGALPTVRLLYLSGIGPKALEKKILTNEAGSQSFTVNNPGVGTACSEHVTTSLGYRYTGTTYNTTQPNTSHFDPADYVGNREWVAKYQKDRTGPYCQFGPVVACHFTAKVPDGGGDDDGDGHVTTELFFNPIGMGPYPPKGRPAANPYNGPGAFSVYCMLLRPQMRAIVKLKADSSCDYTQLYMSSDTGFSADDYAAAGLPNYADFAGRDQATMAASVFEVLKILREVDGVTLTMGPGDKQTTVLSDLKGANGQEIAYKDLDPTIEAQVASFIRGWTPITLATDRSPEQSLKLYITRLQENHFNSTAPLSRNLDVFGQPAPANYGVDPDTMEVRGVTGLCVADASLFPKVVYCHPVASVFAIAEYAAEKILQSRGAANGQ